jgi:hypothetical protein
MPSITENMTFDTNERNKKTAAAAKKFIFDERLCGTATAFLFFLIFSKMNKNDAYTKIKKLMPKQIK